MEYLAARGAFFSSHVSKMSPTTDLHHYHMVFWGSVERHLGSGPHLEKFDEIKFRY